MAFEGLTEKLTNAFNKLRGKGRLTEADVREAMREVRLALLEADVSYKVVKDFVKKVTERAVGSDVLKALSPAQQVIKIVNEELTELMGGKAESLITAPKGPTVVMMVGLQGAGKTTNAAKLAGHFKRSGRRPLLVACDVYRPAAIKQLEVVGEQVGVPVFQMGQDDPVKIAREAVDHARKHGNDLVFLDTAGRLHVDDALMDELRRIKDAVQPNEIMLVVDAMIGQDAVNAAVAFDEALDLTGVMLTKLDGDARGGAALSIKATTGKPIKFAGVGEKLDQIEVFHPDRMVSRILGMGDMLSLIEKAEANYDLEQAAKLEEKLKKNRFTLSDYYEQLLQLRKMGSLSDIMGMLPGMQGKLDGAELDESILTRTEAIILSMTPKEREDPSVLNASRKKRIAAGSGTTVQNVNQVLKQFELMQNMTRQIAGGRIPKGVRGMMGGGMPGMGGLPGLGGGGHSRGRTKPNKKRKKKKR
ncbi:MAG: signal recognition particle protein [Oscillospiraceae bacterium]|nr:signal recognition particle protein [Oscillospiraceae bacterium]